MQILHLYYEQYEERMHSRRKNHLLLQSQYLLHVELLVFRVIQDDTLHLHEHLVSFLSGIRQKFLLEI